MKTYKFLDIVVEHDTRVPLKLLDDLGAQGYKPILVIPFVETERDRRDNLVETNFSQVILSKEFNSHEIPI